MESSKATFSSKDSQRRTNSLAFAKNDCHTCLDLEQICDRRRPRCGTCISSRRRCGGFAMDLVWKDLAVSSSGTVSTPRDSPPPKRLQTEPSRKRSDFKFVQGRSKRKRQPKANNEAGPLRSSNQVYFPVVEPLLKPSDSENSLPSPFGISEELSITNPIVELEVFNAESSVSQEIPHEAEVSQTWPISTISNELSSELDMNWMPAGQNNLLDNDELIGSQLTPYGNYNILGNHDGELDNQNILERVHLLTTGVFYQDLSHKYNSILTMYDEEFCVLPLTWDCRANPFRIRRERIDRSSFLLHAVLAISSHHLAKKNNCAALAFETHKHQSTAVQLFSGALNQLDIVSLLDTLLILISFEAAQSASGTWGAHLNGAKLLLEQAQTMGLFPGSTRIRAQVAMFVWWDVTVAFIARKEPRLPITYLETLMENTESDEWSFLTLNGCPIELVMSIARLSKLAAIYERTKRMEWTIFNRFPVDALIDEVKNYLNPNDVRFDNMENLEADTGARRSRFHCIEAWRHGILLYTYRVFITKQHTYSLRLINHLARVILDHIRCIPQTEIIQKQLLLPMFLAASEVGDEHNRAFVRQYCKHWSVRSRYLHFDSASALLEDIWSEWDLSTRSEYWWGTRIRSEEGVQTGDTIPLAQPLVEELFLG